MQLPCLRAVPNCNRDSKRRFSGARAVMGNLAMPLDSLHYTDMIAMRGMSGNVRH
jgi:hypothetical protein